MMESLPVTRQNIRNLGIEFTLGSADIPLCGPARVSLLTGLSVTTHKCDTNKTTWSKFRDSTLGLQERTVARYVQDVGYATGHFGKYINGYGSDPAVPPTGTVGAPRKVTLLMRAITSRLPTRAMWTAPG
jgi:arylsulfatase A-like enzyme